MNTPDTVARRTHPAIVAAAIAVTAASAVTIGAVEGWLPSALSRTTEPVVAAASPTPAAMPATDAGSTPGGRNDLASGAGNAAGTTITVPPGATVRIVPPAPRTAHRHSVGAAPAEPRHEPQRDAAGPAPMPPLPTAPTGAGNTRVADAGPGIYAEPARPAAACFDCGTVTGVREITKQGEGTGLGAILGGVLGGIVGHQFGKGHGNDAMTAAGAIGGAVAGHQIEKSRRATREFEVTVRLDDGTTRSFVETRAGAWQSGDRVRVVNGALTTL